MEQTTAGIPLSNDDESIIHRSLPSPGRQTSSDRLEEVYDVEKTVQSIRGNQYKRIALQFPDELLIDASSVAQKLQSLCGSSTFYVLGDTSYGSCCVDEVAAEHVTADALVHYGRSCLSPTSRLPVIYVFGKLPLNISSLIEKVSASIPGKMAPLLVTSDTTYISSQKAIIQRLELQGYDIVSASLCIETEVADKSNSDFRYTLPGRKYKLNSSVNMADITMLYIGPPSATLTTTLMTHTSLVSAIFSYNPETDDLKQETSQNIALRRRYAVVQKARDAGVIGIVVGTLGVSRYIELIKHLRSIISIAGKKSYLFAMGKLNPSKMANFSEIDAFVLVACGENSMIDSRDFYKPVVTPFELTLALRTRSHEAIPWTGDWLTDFETVMKMPPEDRAASETPSEEYEDEDAPHFSLVTGRYSSSSRPMHASLHTASDSDYAVAKRSTETALSTIGGLYSPAAQHLKQREHWSGLGSDHHDVDGTADEGGAAMTQGRSGIARGYDSYKPETSSTS